MGYLDNNGTTKPLQRVIDAMRQALEHSYGNPSSAHRMGQDARRVLEAARATIAASLGAEHPSELVFTSGGTESINLMFALLADPAHRQIVISAVEHSAVIDAAHRWGGGRRVIEIPVDEAGRLNLDELAKVLRGARSLVSMVYANNETGVIFDLPAIQRLCATHGASLHIDAVQAPGRIPVHLSEMGADMVSLSAHKFHGPKGIGALYVKAGSVHAAPLLPGHQEGELRGGTENLPGIVGMAEAASELPVSLEAMGRVSQIRDDLERELTRRIPGVVINGHRARRLPQTSNISFLNRNAADLVARLARRDFSVSAGAACASGKKPSHVIRAMTHSDERANSSVRLSLSRFTTANEVERAVSTIVEVYAATLPAVVR